MKRIDPESSTGRKARDRARTPWLAAGVVLVLGLAETAAAVCTCQGDPVGHVTVDHRYDDNTDSILSAVEVQCAINCLDGEPDAEGYVPGQVPQILDGGVIEFTPGNVYQLELGLVLPFATRRPLIVNGNGAILDAAEATAPMVMLERRAPADATQRDLDFMLSTGRGWRIENLRFKDRRVRETTAIAIDCAEGLVISGVKLNSTHLGIVLRMAPMSLIEDMHSENTVASEVVLGAVLPSPGTWVLPPPLAVNGRMSRECDGTVLRHSLVYGADLAPPNIVAGNTNRLVVDGVYNDGKGHSTFLERNTGRATSTSLRDGFFWWEENEPDALVDADGRGMVTVQNVQIDGNAAFLTRVDSKAEIAFVVDSVRSVYGIQFPDLHPGSAEDVSCSLSFAFVNLPDRGHYSPLYVQPPPEPGEPQPDPPPPLSMWRDSALGQRKGPLALSVNSFGLRRFPADNDCDELASAVTRTLWLDPEPDAAFDDDSDGVADTGAFVPRPCGTEEHVLLQRFP